VSAPKLTEAQQRLALGLLDRTMRALADRIDLADVDTNATEAEAAAIVRDARAFLQRHVYGALRGKS
jgi:hypothetical protein